MGKNQPTPEDSLPDTPQPGEVYEIPVEGSLALLALGARGIIAWREKKAEVNAKREENQNE